MQDWSGKTAAVTGAGSGLGAAMADLFASAGAAVALLDIDATRAEAKADDLRQRGHDAVALAVDVADRQSVTVAASAVRDRFGGCHALCANVGVQQFGAIDRLTEQDWQWVMSVNFHGVVHTVDAFLPLLRRCEGQRHISITSSASYFQLGIRMAAYVASKFAVTGYGEVLRAELAGEGINVSLLFPAGMATRHIESSMAARPAAFGPSRLDREDIDAMIADSAVDAADIATPDYAVRNLLDDLATCEPYMFTHGSYRNQIEERQQRQLSAFERMLARTAKSTNIDHNSHFHDIRSGQEPIT
jgi:NAD(P)-dependent dehydrogenase (short-subunit alcohol dehydrogenase family)